MCCVDLLILFPGPNLRCPRLSTPSPKNYFSFYESNRIIRTELFILWKIEQTFLFTRFCSIVFHVITERHLFHHQKEKRKWLQLIMQVMIFKQMKKNKAWWQCVLTLASQLENLTASVFLICSGGASAGHVPVNEPILSTVRTWWSIWTRKQLHVITCGARFNSWIIHKNIRRWNLDWDVKLEHQSEKRKSTFGCFEE